MKVLGKYLWIVGHCIENAILMGYPPPDDRGFYDFDTLESFLNAAIRKDSTQ